MARDALTPRGASHCWRSDPASNQVAGQLSEPRLSERIALRSVAPAAPPSHGAYASPSFVATENAPSRRIRGSGAPTPKTRRRRESIGRRDATRRYKRPHAMDDNRQYY
ncbi:uncharacterized protein LOC123010108 [Tribolium madens]|uniref:uncharacterized protein LOC123010108 n=1 Tax=Tribolium madens TaxID=41895 RepID=UPI001CF747AC|nr:uncharacterized protein LOC123010108 [Tribolium madens]